MQSITDFATTLRYGLGRAILFLQSSYRREEHFSILLNACLKREDFEGEESSRGRYIVDALNATGEPAFYKAHLLTALANREPSFNDGKLLNLTAVLAREGDEHFRQAMYGYYERALQDGDLLDAESLIAIDGTEGFLRVLRLARQYRGQEADDLTDVAVAMTFAWEHVVGDEEVREIRRTLSLSDLDLATYLETIYALRETGRQYQHPPAIEPTYEAISEYLKSPPVSRGQLRKVGLKMEDETARRFASELIQEPDPQRQVYLLSLFRERSYPLDAQPLLDLLETGNAKLRRVAILALYQVNDKRVRQVGDIFFADGKYREAIELFIANPEPHDSTLLLQAIHACESDDDALHDVGFPIREYLERNEISETVTVLLALYERERCSLCRYMVVEELLKREALTEEIRQELTFDAYEDLRDLIVKGVSE